MYAETSGLDFDFCLLNVAMIAAAAATAAVQHCQQQ